MRVSEHLEDEAVQVREAEDDHDVLTYAEVSARLREEIASQREVIARLDADGGPTEQLAAAHRRLDLLRDAARRNARRPITAENFERFFGYPGTTRRDT